MAGSWVTLQSAHRDSFSAYVAVPAQPNGSALVILQEIFGINPYVCGIVETFAEAGFVAIAPDLFWRQQHRVSLDPTSENDRTRAMSLLNGLDEGLAVDDALCAARYVQQLPATRGRLGCVGYCLGGKLAFLLASHEEISCAVSYYGVQIQHCLDRVRSLCAPVLLHLAEKDHLCPPEAQAAIARRVHNLPTPATLMNHPGVGHGFARPGGPAYDAASAARADKATFALLRETLLA